MEKNKVDGSLNSAVESLRNGEVILCPTDTIYGLSCDATNPSAIENLRRIKGKEYDAPLIVLVNSDRLFNQCTGDIPEVAWDLIDNASSPLTLILPSSNFLPESLRPNQMVGIRYVKEGFVSDLIGKLNRPIVSTSANLSGQVTALNYNEIDSEIIEKVDFIVPQSYDLSKQRSASKILRLEANGMVEILRK